MKAVLTAITAGLRHRRLQTAVIAFVILLSSGAATLALSLLVESDAPYDHAFARTNGAHLTVTYAAHRVSPARLQATGSAHGVTAAAGPWPQVITTVTAAQAQFGSFQKASDATIVGRSRPDTAVDRLTMESGRWPRARGEIVLAQHLADLLSLGVGDHLSATNARGHPSLNVVGIAASINPNTDAWVLPDEVSSLVSRGSPLQYQMLYRVHPADTAAQLRRVTQAIAGRLPAGTVESTGTYLDVKRNADLTSAVMVPFLLAFSVFALVAAVLIIANVVSGVVIASYRDIGVMKSVGFTPGQVVLVLFGQVLLPALAGCLAGIPLGTLASQPFLQATAHALGLPSAFTAAVPVDLLVLAVIGLVATLAALSPSWRAGRLSAVAAITRGAAPAANRAGPVGQAVSRLPLPRAISLGLADILTRPLRSITTTGAILIGVATIVFALSLHLSLGQVAAHLARDRYVPVTLGLPPPNAPNGPFKKGGQTVALPPPPSDRQITAALRATPGTARFVAEAQDQILVPGIAEPIPYIGYRGPSSWTGYALIAGRWFAHPGEVVAPTRLIQQAHLHLGERFTAHIHGRPASVTLVGEILDQADGDLLLRGGWATLMAGNPQIAPDQYEIGLKRGVDAAQYAAGLSQTLAPQGPNVFNIDIARQSSSDTTFILFNGVIAGLALVLVAIAVAGVFNTLILTTREKVRDVAILKAVGMAPLQVVAMVVSSVAMLGLVAGALGVPLGLELHRRIIEFMGQVASGTRIPPAFFDLIDHATLPLFALAGIAIAALGAWLPAQWAASSGVAEVLQSE